MTPKRRIHILRMERETYCGKDPVVDRVMTVAYVAEGTLGAQAVCQTCINNAKKELEGKRVTRIGAKRRAV